MTEIRNTSQPFPRWVTILRKRKKQITVLEQKIRKSTRDLPFLLSNAKKEGEDIGRTKSIEDLQATVEAEISAARRSHLEQLQKCRRDAYQQRLEAGRRDISTMLETSERSSSRDPGTQELNDGPEEILVRAEELSFPSRSPSPKKQKRQSEDKTPAGPIVDSAASASKSAVALIFLIFYVQFTFHSRHEAQNFSRLSKAAAPPTPAPIATACVFFGVALGRTLFGVWVADSMIVEIIVEGPGLAVAVGEELEEDVDDVLDVEVVVEEALVVDELEVEVEEALSPITVIVEGFAARKKSESKQPERQID
ncbi:hypothetical protein G7Y89_g1628 [Cudoniella acicularis]|uniref:Uncharacterized protein n=1 Tax=Cudoniella acicularis TaxID=354080 RepID=A0A8H4W6U5_9HELO|nr:hypothetical protein G7Y89_g1628 [Cudoniella acicularis]